MGAHRPPPAPDAWLFADVRKVAPRSPAPPALDACSAVFHGDARRRVPTRGTTRDNTGVRPSTLRRVVVFSVLLLLSAATPATFASATCTPTLGLPVIFIHGYPGNAGTWRSLTFRLAPLGLCDGGIVTAQSADADLTAADFYRLELSSNQDLSLDEQAEELARAVDAVLRRNGVAKVLLVGHGMGGLAARQYLEFDDRYGSAGKVDALIMVGTPHLGSDWADALLAGRIPAQVLRQFGIEPDSVAVRLLAVGSDALDVLNAAAGLLPRSVAYESLIVDRGALTSSDGFASVASQNLESVIEAAHLTGVSHTASVPVFRLPTGCDATSVALASIGVPEVHTCEPDDPDVQQAIFDSIVGMNARALAGSRATTATTLRSSVNPAVAGQELTLTANVTTATPLLALLTGTVTFLDGKAVLGTAPVSRAGDAVLTASIHAVGLHRLTASYGGNLSFGGSTSTALTQTINRATSATTLTAAPDVAVVGQPVTFTAQASPVAPAAGTPTGTVTFRDGSTTLGSATVDAAGRATLTTGALAVGPHPVTANYSGDANFRGSVSTAVTETIDKASTVTTVTVFSSLPYGVDQSFGARVVPVPPATGTPTGLVTFRDGSTVVAHGSLNTAGEASVFVIYFQLEVGSHSITATYEGDHNFNASPSEPGTEIITKTATTTRVVAFPNPAVAGQLLRIFAEVETQNPRVPAAGIATFHDGSIVLGTAMVGPAAAMPNLGSGLLALTTLPVGSHTITATFEGSNHASPSTSPPKVLDVKKATSVTKLTVSPNPAVWGQPVSLVATVKAVLPGMGRPTGDVIFHDGATTLGTAALNGDGGARLTTSSLTTGLHHLTASYGGDGSFLGNTSAVVMETVSKAATTTTLTASPNPIVKGQPVTLNATVTAKAPGSGTPTGTVTFRDGAIVLGTATLSAGAEATLTTAALSAGSHALKASYGGDGNFNASPPAVVTEIVNKTATTTTLTTANSTVVGEPMTLSAQVSAVAPGAGTPTGTVTFRDGSTILGTAILNGAGQASLTRRIGSSGSHALTASYGGDANFTSSTSPALAATVSIAETTTTVTVGPNPAVVGQPLTLGATVTVVAPGGGIPGGTVTFRDGAISLGTATLNGAGRAMLTAGAPLAGSDAITAEYEGNANFGPSTSAAVAEMVNQAKTSTALTIAPSVSVTGQSVIFSAKVEAVAPGNGTPTGAVTFRDGSTVLETVFIDDDGRATLRTRLLPVGVHPITASYEGNRNFVASASKPLTETVNKAATTTTLVPAPNPADDGQAVILTATVNPVAPGAGLPTGTVTFRQGSTVLGQGAIDTAGHASFPTSALAIGAHAITAHYEGDLSFREGTSAAVVEVVR
jgi:pimeloyl-ACP methyl ester carboxylesterase